MKKIEVIRSLKYIQWVGGVFNYKIINELVTVKRKKINRLGFGRKKIY